MAKEGDFGERRDFGGEMVAEGRSDYILNMIPF
jgi:hypothetical protein